MKEKEHLSQSPHMPVQIMCHQKFPPFLTEYLSKKKKLLFKLCQILNALL